jgi:hypothetical protein
VRFRPVPFAWAAGGALAAIGVGLLIRYTLIVGSAEESGRSISEVRHYSAEPLDFLDRWHAPRSEEFVYLGWLTLALAVGGLVVLARRSRRLGVLLGLAVVVPLLLALGTHLPGYEAVWRHFSPLHFTRVPGRLLPIANLALAALAAFACAEVVRRSARRSVAVAAALVVLVGLDLVVQPLSAAAADPDNQAYAALASARSSRVLELPLFEPGVHYGSVYDYYQLQEAREQPGGYSTLAPEKAFDFFATHNRLNCGVWLPGDSEELRVLGITRLLLHRGLYLQAHRRGAAFAEWALWENAWHPAGDAGPITLWAPGEASHPPGVPPLPPPGPPVLCSGWRGQTMTQREATLWVYGEGPVRLHFEAEQQTLLRVLVDEKVADQIGFTGRGTAEATLTGRGWHPILLIESTRGVRLLAVEQ